MAADTLVDEILASRVAKPWIWRCGGRGLLLLSNTLDSTAVVRMPTVLMYSGEVMALRNMRLFVLSDCGCLRSRWTRKKVSNSSEKSKISWLGVQVGVGSDFDGSNPGTDWYKIFHITSYPFLEVLLMDVMLALKFLERDDGIRCGRSSSRPAAAA